MITMRDLFKMQKVRSLSCMMNKRDFTDTHLMSLERIFVGQVQSPALGFSKIKNVKLMV